MYGSGEGSGIQLKRSLESALFEVCGRDNGLSD